jgi:phosphatidylserine decarboxylase
MRYRLEPLWGVAREGWLLILPLLAVTAVLHAVDLQAPAVAAAAGALFVAAWCREPGRPVTGQPLGLLAPLSGTVVQAGTVHDPILDRSAQHIRIRSNPVGGYAIRAPTEGVVLEAAGQPRSFSHLRTDEGADVSMAVSMGSLIGAPLVWCGFGQRVGHGRRVGARRLAWCLDLWLPADARLEVTPGCRVTSGATIVARLAEGKSA